MEQIQEQIQKGMWLPVAGDSNKIACSNCGNVFKVEMISQYRLYRYCPYCAIEIDSKKLM